MLTAILLGVEFSVTVSFSSQLGSPMFVKERDRFEFFLIRIFEIQNENQIKSNCTSESRRTSSKLHLNISLLLHHNDTLLKFFVSTIDPLAVVPNWKTNLQIKEI